MEGDILKEQLNYYRARAPEYDQSITPTDDGDPAADAEWTQIAQALQSLPPEQEVLELACGTGIWTQVLLPISRAITAVDGAPEMLDLNQAKVGDERVQYECFDLFTWQPGRAYDLVFFAFWISHVPPDRLPDFLDKVLHATRMGGQVFIVDEPSGGRQLSGRNEAGMYQTRQLEDGRSYQIIKVYHDPDVLQRELEARGFRKFSVMRGDCFFSLSATRCEKAVPRAANALNSEANLYPV